MYTSCPNIMNPAVYSEIVSGVLYDSHNKQTQIYFFFN
jgi:hypothetical protein